MNSLDLTGILYAQDAHRAPRGFGHRLLSAGATDVTILRDLRPPCNRADLNRDDTVDERDMIMLHGLLGTTCVGDGSNACVADPNQEGVVGLDDLSILLQQWGPCATSSLPSTDIRIRILR